MVDDVVLDVGEVETDVAARSDRVRFVALFREAADDVCFASQQAQERHNGFCDTRRSA